MKPVIEPILLVAAIIIGSLTGLFAPVQIYLVDFFIIAMLFFLFYNVSFSTVLQGMTNKKYLSIAWISNFVLIPTLAFLIASIFVDNTSAVFVGLIIYLVAPCTDWFLGFTKLAKGNVEINSALLPINLLSQILLLPVYLYIFTANSVGIPFASFTDILLNWVLLPFVVAQILRFVTSKVNKKGFNKSESLAEIGMLTSLVLLVFTLFDANINALMENLSLLPVIVIVIFIFFVATYYMTKFIAKKCNLPRKEEISLTMTTAARNAPLMLAISIGLFPEQTVIHLVLIIGMLVEFPHLITLTYLLKKH